MSSEEEISWYHGDSSREVAEEILLKGNNEDGTFLVRDSTTAAGDYVLSVLQNREIAHYQIRRHGEDAFFSIEEQVIIHGLETLINYYQTRSNNGLVCKLGKPIKKNPPPPDARLHGRTNLLHRATKEANLTVVSELLKCGYRSLDAKNQVGETAVHLATKQNEDIILEKLISSGANVNCRDQVGNTPLHYACQNNFLSIVKILVMKGGANVQMRNSKTGWVAMHEAAFRGHMDIIQFLLSIGSPARPRTEDNETPDTLARANGYFQCVEILKAFQAPVNQNKEDWYHGTLGRQEAIQILRESGAKDGSFLVRFSDRTGYVLSMIHDDQPYNYPIETEARGYYIDNGPYLDSLEHVIAHYSAMSDGLPTTLQHPIKPRPKPPLPDQHPTLTRLTAMTLKSPSKSQKSPIKNDGSATLPLPPKPRLPRRSLDTNMQTLSPEKQSSQVSVFIPEENLVFKEVIGEGEFGSVYKAILQNNLGQEVEVAVKTLRQEYVSTNKEQFVREGKVLMALTHHCIVRLIGLSQGNDLQMVQELMPLGSMLDYIRRYPDRINPEYELYIWASQIALGMEYLEKKKFVHRDLAARNILLASKHQAKIGDFGLSRMLSTDRDYYKATHGGKWPIKWYAPESYNFGSFSSASDIWSFGVTLWEMFSYGQTPYGNLRGAEAIELVEKGERLPRPERCSPELYVTMERCWAYKSSDRPTFSQLVEEFRTHTSYENIKELILIANMA